MGRDQKSFELHARNKDVKDNSGEISHRNEDQVIENCGKGDPCHKMTTNFPVLCCRLLQKIKVVSVEIEHLAGVISKPSAEGPAWFLLSAYSKM